MHGYTREDLLERQKPEYKGATKRPTAIEMLKEGDKHDFLQNHHKKMKMRHTIYADFESLVRKVQGCKPNPEKGSVTVKTEQHEACGFAYTIVRSDGKACGPMVYRGEYALYLFLQHLLQERKLIREYFSIKTPLVMTPGEAQRTITHRWI